MLKLAVVCCSIGAVVVAALILSPMHTLFVLGGGPRYSPPDFMQFYFAGRLAASGQIDQLYRRQAYEPLVEELRSRGERIGAFPFNRPAFAAYLCVPLSWFPYRVALQLATLANFALLGILIWKLPAWLDVPAWYRPCLVVFLPFLWGIGLGQDILLFTVLVAASFRLAGSRESLAGIVLGLCAVKPHLIWAMPLALVAARKRKMLLSFLATGLLLALVSLGSVGMRGVQEWINLLHAPSTDYRPETMANLRAMTLHFGWPAAALAALFAVSCAGAILWRGSAGQKLALGLLLSLLFGPHTYLYDLSLVAVAAPLCASPAALLLLLPWAHFYSRDDLLPWILALLAGLGFAAARILLSRQDSTCLTMTVPSRC